MNAKNNKSPRAASLRKRPHSPGRDLAHRSHKLHVPLRHSSASFGGLKELTHGPTDIGFDGAFKHLLWRKLRVDLVKSWKHIHIDANKTKP